MRNDHRGARASRRDRDRRSAAERTRHAPTEIPPRPASSESDAIRPVDDFQAAPHLWPVATICVTACASLGIMQFLGSEQAFAQFFPSEFRVFDPYLILRIKAWWVASILLGFVVLPVVVMAVAPNPKLRDCNLSLRGFLRHFWIYIGLFGAVLPVIWFVSLTPAFYNFYPMYGQAGRSWTDLLMWEGMYIGQFVALEFFFRGFLVGGLSKQIGILAVPVSVMPYMMIHFTKPLPEAAASIIAGFVLGYLAWKTQSIWGGVCIHCAVAVSMDLLALAHKGQLPWLHG
jgi:membrane protease YdiL (CAAX protease family)